MSTHTHTHTHQTLITGASKTPPIARAGWRNGRTELSEAGRKRPEGPSADCTGKQPVQYFFFWRDYCPIPDVSPVKFAGRITSRGYHLRLLAGLVADGFTRRVKTILSRFKNTAHAVRWNPYVDRNKHNIFSQRRRLHNYSHRGLTPTSEVAA